MKHISTANEAAPVVRGMGVYCPLGTNCAQLETALLDQRDSIATITSFDASRFLSDQASAFGKDVDVNLETGEAEWMDRATLFTIAAYREALEQSGVNLDDIDPGRIGVCLGSSHSGLVRTEDVARGVIDDAIDTMDPKVISATLVSHCTAVIKRMSGARGRVLTISSACASSNSAIGVGADMIRKGEADVVIAGGADTVSLSVMAGFNALRALAAEKSAPFGQDIGLSIGEGAGIVILTRADVAGAEDHGRILGYGLSGDAHHATAPDQDGAGAANAIVAALKDAAVEAAEIGYVNAHGTGTEANDGAESRAIAKLFGDSVPVSSTKGYYGHTLGASGVIETISSILMAKHGKAPANLRIETLREGVEALNFAKADSTAGPDTTLLVNNFGFGGNNSSLLVRVGHEAAESLLPASNLDEIVITGAGACSAAGLGRDVFEKTMLTNEPIAEIGASGFATAKVGPLKFKTPDLKPFARTSPTTKHALVALKEAMGDDADIFAENQRSGLIGGAVFGAQKPTEKFMESVFQGDPALANAHYFPMITMNATGGATSLAYQIKGYTTTVCGSAAALAYAADLAAVNRQDRVAVVAGDEMTERLERIYHRTGVVAHPDTPRAGRAEALGEFGGAITLERRGTAEARNAHVIARLRGWATRQDPVDLSVEKSGEALIRAQKAALEQAGLSAENITRIVVLDKGLAPTHRATANALKATFGPKTPPAIRPADVFGYAPSSGPLMTVIAALLPEKGITMATGYDVIGDAFAFVLEGGDA